MEKQIVSKKTKKIFLFSLLGISVLLFGLLFISTDLSSPSVNNDEGLHYTSSVCRQVIRADGTREVPECSHNLLYNAGRNMTRDFLMLGTGTPITNITLCNASAGCGDPVVTNTEAFNLFANCGLSSASDGTTSIIGSYPGNWSVWKTFTSSCDNVLTNLTRIGNDSGYFAGNTFTLVTLQTNDQLTINWSLMII